MKWIIIILALIILWFIIKYPAAAVIIVLLAIAAVVALSILKRNKNLKQKLLAQEEELRQKRIKEEKTEQLNKNIQNKKDQFASELNSIPRSTIAIKDPAKRQYLKDMPEYEYSNVTAKTDLNKIFPLVFIDVETTGLSPASSEIVEVSAIKFDKGMIPVSCFTTLCCPKNPIPPSASAINHITDEMVEGFPSFRQVAPALSEFIEGCNLAGHNLDFDLRFIYVHGADIPFEKKMYDTLELAQRTIKRSEIGNHKLETLCSWYGIYRDDAHRSLSDCYATAKIFNYLIHDKTSRDLKNETNQ